MRISAMLCCLAITLGPVWAGTEQLKQKTFQGVDIKGKQRSCVPMKPKVCTKIFTPEDKFGSDCKEQDHMAIQCDCHDWICVK